MSTVIHIEGLGKKYKLGQVHTHLLSEKIGNSLRSISQKIKNPGSAAVRRSVKHGNEIWALRDVNLQINAGEVVGVIGRNGAGKSTLLKILSRITGPTTGWIDMEGRVGCLLEVGTGFHPELTGRENIFLNGAILGMTKAEIKRKFDDIVAFSEIEKFLDTPVKRYSSGMYVRLAFSVAAHLDPEILIVDEVLAVGDASFQKKCLGKMQEVSTGGRTVLFVSHNMTAVRELCERVVWLNDGKVARIGNTDKIVSEYLHENAGAVHEQVWTDKERMPGNEKVRMRMARLSPEPEDAPISVNTPLIVEFEYWNACPDTELNLTLYLNSLEGTCVFNSDSSPQIYPAGFIRETCRIPGNLLNDGTYRMTIMVVKDRSFDIYKHEDILVFDVQDVERECRWYGKWPGFVRPQLQWTSKYIETSKTV